MPELVDGTAIRAVASPGSVELVLSDGSLTQISSEDRLVWAAPPQPSLIGGSGDPFDIRMWAYNDFITNMWEPLRLANPGWITRQAAGTDQSGTYTLWRYVFEPPTYQRTVLISANLHGNELIGAAGVYLFLKHVADNWASDTAVLNLRWNTRLVVIPSLNPWGCSQSPRTRTNSRGVNINRNFDYKWAAFIGPVGPDYKGAAPMSEAETVAAKTLLDDYPDAVAWLDLHDMDYASGAWDHVAYLPDYGLPSRFSGLLSSLLAEMAAPGETTQLISASWPGAFNYGAQRGFHAATPEVRSDVDGDNKWDAPTMTRGVNWYGNAIIHAARFNKPAVDSTTEPFAHHLIYQAGADVSPVVSSTSYIELTDFRLEFPIGVPGILEVNGYVVVLSGGTALMAYVSPSLGQAAHPYNGLGAVKNNVWEAYCSVPSSSRATIPIHATLPVMPSWTDGSDGARFALFVRVTAGSVTVARLAVTVKFTPSRSAAATVIYNATGRAGTGPGALLRVFP